ncbi:competence protein ComE [Mergibacter septicus]|uniref:Competence protein ComE n=1 Tax=Mergibacter septicus TaxID=221402 RepID=A0A8E3S8M0_9PAST|nr:ComEA family DNA-binding protein [Mergibacter septicus]AWX15675.1 competence protein ComE [Mergibacter septicus]QDJ14928.1 competence protein ComE [Mergibacter septicus]UTU47645.1 ComEA family DNA-binding protein [Mergibacter septicus]WMR96749.1 ComEA family DNA-binding protein [Mergibacter septicus]
MGLIRSLLLLMISSGVFITSAFATDTSVANQVTQEVTQVTAQAAQGIEEKVNINTATVEQLQRVLQNVGRKKAQAIVDYRQKNGNFTSVDQLSDVPGIGTVTLERNRDRILL